MKKGASQQRRVNYLKTKNQSEKSVFPSDVNVQYISIFMLLRLICHPQNYLNSWTKLNDLLMGRSPSIHLSDDVEYQASTVWWFHFHHRTRWQMLRCCNGRNVRSRCAPVEFWVVDPQSDPAYSVHQAKTRRTTICSCPMQQQPTRLQNQQNKWIQTRRIWCCNL